MQREEFLKEKLINYLEFNNNIPSNDEVFNEITDELNLMNEGIFDWLGKRIEENSKKKKEELINTLRSGINPKAECRLEPRNSESYLYDTRKGFDCRLDTKVFSLIKSMQIPKRVINSNLHNLTVDPDIIKWAEKALFKGFKIPLMDNDEDIQTIAEKFAQGGLVKTPLVYTSKDASKLADIIEKEPAMLKDFVKQGSDEVVSIAKKAKELKAKQNMKEYTIWKARDYIADCVLQGYHEGRGLFIIACEGIAEELVKEHKKLERKK